ncbi:MAG: hypothetical protein ACTHMF_08405 [Leifsonia sp.]|uniref:hypothetical protein n=1 Tax=Leifsonia sp. TaxID=1870902 RepID=UPI003F80F090
MRDQVVAFLPRGLLISTKSVDSLQLQHRVGGVPLSGLSLTLFSAPNRGGVVCLALPRV